MIAPAHIERAVRGQHLTGLGNPRLAGEHQPCHHQRLRPRAAFGKTAFNQQLIDAALGRFWGTGRMLGHGQTPLLARKVRA
jgi:hypothetical protein